MGYSLAGDGRPQGQRLASRTVPAWPGLAGTYLPTRLTSDEVMASTRHHTHIDLERLTGNSRRAQSRTARVRTRSRSRSKATRNCVEYSRGVFGSHDLDVVINCSITKVDRDDTVSAVRTDEEPRDRPGDRRQQRDHVRHLDACAGMLTGVRCSTT